MELLLGRFLNHFSVIFKKYFIVGLWQVYFIHPTEDSDDVVLLWAQHLAFGHHESRIICSYAAAVLFSEKGFYLSENIVSTL
jgi:hypothetical protein